MTLFRIIENGILKLKKLYATMVNVDASAFSKNLENTDNTVQKCLDKVDQFDLGGGSLPEGTYRQTLTYNQTDELVATNMVDVDLPYHIVTLNSRADLGLGDLPEIACQEGSIDINGNVLIKAPSNPADADERTAVSISGQRVSCETYIKQDGFKEPSVYFESTIIETSQYMRVFLNRFPSESDDGSIITSEVAGALTEPFRVRPNGSILSDYLRPEFTGNLNNVISKEGILTKEGINLSYRFDDFLFDTTTLTDVPELFVELTEGNVYKIEGFFVVKSTENLIFRDGFKLGFNTDDDYIGYCNIGQTYYIYDSSFVINENDINPITPMMSMRTLYKRDTKLNNVNPIIWNLYDTFSWMSGSLVPPFYWMIKFEFLVESNSTQDYYLKIAKERDNAGSQILMAGAWLKATLQSGY